VSRAWQRARLANLCVDAGLSEPEQLFVQSVIRLADTSGVLTDNALAARTASLTVPWASSLMSSYKDGQPRWKYVERALRSALDACNRLQPTRLPIPTASNWQNRISTVLASDQAGTVPSLTVTGLEVEAHQLEITSFVLRQTANNDAVAFDVLAAEVALGLISHSVDIDLLLDRIKRLKPGKASFREDLAKLLAGQPESFNVLVPVGGAKIFDSIESLNPSAKMRQVILGRRKAFTGWGRAGPKAGEFVDNFEKTLNHPGVPQYLRRQRAMVTVTVRACDIHAAALMAHRTVAEALDQYVAGHPFVQFEIHDIVGVALLNKSWVQPVPLRQPTERAVRPLTIPWPDVLRQSMRVSHLLRNTTAPMTRVALAWVMIESSGLKPEDIDDIAKMLALETLRQGVFMPYRFLVQDAMDREAVRYYRDRAEVRRIAARRRWRQAHGVGVPASVAATLQRSSLRAALLRVMYDLLAQKAEQRSANIRASLSRLDAQINPTVDIAIGHRAFLPSVTKWLFLLYSSFETSSDEQATALRSLLSEVGAPVRTSIEDLAQMTRSGATAGKRLSESRRWLADVLNSFYAARNMNLHRGIFNSEIDIALGELAILVSDALFEVWATWYPNGLPAI